MAKDTINLEKMQRSDHDTLLRLEVKVDALIADVKELKDGTNLQLTEHELRIRIIEKVHEEINPLQVVQEFKEVQLKIRDFQTIWKFVVTIAGAVGGIIGFILSVVADSLHLFGR